MKYLFVFLIILLTSPIVAQQNSLSDIDSRRNHLSKTGIKILSGFAAANIAYGTIAANNTSGSTKYFHEMNAIWNGVTLGIVGIGVLTAKKEGKLSLAESINKQQGVEKLFLFNAGLDLAYIAGGAYVKERAKNTSKNTDKLNGYGRSIMLQGAVLLVFDGVMYLLHNNNGKKLNKLLSDVSKAATGNAVSFLVSIGQ